jgi:glycosyltransferase involved in cell wall biosynthesis
MIKVSVILTTYNSENKIQEVIDSIHKQEGRDELFELELLVVDDCSTDATQDILLKNNINFQFTSKNTGGPNHGRNIALSICTGNYICIADHDDIWFSNKIIQLLAVVDLAPIISSGYILSDKSLTKEVSRVNNSAGYILYEKNKTFISKLTKSKVGQQTYLGSIMFCSSLKYILFEEQYGMIDFDWVLKLFNNQKSVEVCNALYLRKVDGSNLSLNQQYRINDYQYSLQSIDKYKSEYEKEVKLAERRINGSMGRYYYLIGNMRLARVYFLKSSLELKTILYLITTFVGSKIVKRYFKIFG